MDPITNLGARCALVTETNAIEARWPGDGCPPPADVDRLQDIAFEFAELVETLDQWRQGGGFDPYSSAPDPDALAATRLVVDTAFGAGGLADVYCLAPSQLDGRDVLIFAERTADGLVPLAEIIPPRDGYTPVASGD